MSKPITLGIAFALTALVVSAPAGSKITSITSKNIGKGVEIAIKGESLKKPKTFFMRDGKSFVVDFSAKLTTNPSRAKVQRSGVDYFNYAQYNPKTARIHLQVKKGIKPTVVEEDGTWYIRVGVTVKPFAVTEDDIAMAKAVADLNGETFDRATFIALAKLASEKSTKAENLPKPEASPATNNKFPSQVTEEQIAMAKAIADLKGEEFDRAEYVALATAALEASNKAKGMPKPKTTSGASVEKMTTAVELNELPKPQKSEPMSAKWEGHVVTTGMIVGLGKKEGYTEEQPDRVKPSPKIPVANNPLQDVRVTIASGDTDVRALLQVLAKEAGVNIISSASVSPKDDPALMSLDLTDVSLDFAMNSITAMNDLRYARIDNTFVVTKSSEFHKVMRGIMQRDDDYETRVVQISSGEAAQIRDAALMAIPQDGSGGYYELIDPTSRDYSTNPAVVSGTANTGGDVGSIGAAGAALGGAIGGAGASVGTTPPSAAAGTPKKLRARYMMLVGESDRLDSIEAYIRDLDARITESFSLTNDIDTLVVPIYSGQTGNIKTTLIKLLEGNPRSMDYSIEESSVKELAEGEESTKVVIIAGPAKEIGFLEARATSMDETLCIIGDIDRPTGPDGFKKFYEVVDLKFIEPMLAEFDLKARVRGLHVTLLPDPVTPGIEGEDQSEKQEQPADAGDATSTGGVADLTRAIGHEQMRLVLRGTRSQIEKAKAYLAVVDIPARQVAIELRVMELTKEEALKIGLDWSILSSGGIVNLGINQGLGITASTPGTFTATKGNLFNQGKTGTVLGMLDEISNERNLIARPNALISDGRGTRLFVGDTIRYVKTITASQNGTSVEIDEVDVGVTINIQARIGAEGNIAFVLDQNFSILNGFTPVPGGGEIPQTSDRETTMFVNMQSGETIALGGLILDQVRKSRSGIPILKDLPIIGHLFSRTNNSTVRTELVFFLTAVEVTKETRANAAAPRTSLEKTPDPQKDYFGGRGKGGGTGGGTGGGN